MVKRKMSIGYIAPKSKAKSRKVVKKTLWSRVPQNPFPDRALTKLKYVERISMDPGALVRHRHLFNASGLYDPNYTGTGHQPMGFDQYAAIYNHYHVKQSWCKVTLIAPNNEQDSQQDAVILVLGLNDDVSNDPRVDTALMEDKNSSVVSIHGSEGSTTLTKFYSKKDFFPVANQYSTHASTSTNPAESTYFDINLISQGSDPGQWKALVEITYLAEFYERKDLQGS